MQSLTALTDTALLTEYRRFDLVIEMNLTRGLTAGMATYMTQLEQEVWDRNIHTQLPARMQHSFKGAYGFEYNGEYRDTTQAA